MSCVFAADEHHLKNVRLPPPIGCERREQAAKLIRSDAAERHRLSDTLWHYRPRRRRHHRRWPNKN